MIEEVCAIDDNEATAATEGVVLFVSTSDLSFFAEGARQRLSPLGRAAGERRAAC